MGTGGFKEGHAEHPYIPLLMSAPGIGWVLAFTIAGDRRDLPLRLPRADRLHGPLPEGGAVGRVGSRGPLSKHGPTYLRWALIEATMHALRHPAYAERYQRTKRRLGRQRGAKVPQIEIAAGSPTRSGTCSLATRSSLREAPLFSGGLTALLDLRPKAKHPIPPDPPAEEAVET